MGKGGHWPSAGGPAKPDGMTFDPRSFRNALGCYATGVTIVSGLSATTGRPVGSTVNSFASVSLDPPLVLFSLITGNNSAEHFAPGRPFAVNVLAADQIHLSNHFAKSFDDKWNGIPHDIWDTGAPIVPGAVSNFEGLVTANHDGGDHVIIVGRVQRMACSAEEGTPPPLLYYRGRYAAVTKS